MDGWVGGWMDGWIDRDMLVYLNAIFFTESDIRTNALLCTIMLV